MITSFEEDKIQIVARTRFHAFIIPDSRWEMLQILGLWYSWLRNGAVQKDLTLSDCYNHHCLPRAEWRCITPSWVKSIWITSICTCDESYTIVHVAHIHIIWRGYGSQVYESHTEVKLHITGTVWHQYSSQVWCIN